MTEPILKAARYWFSWNGVEPDEWRSFKGCECQSTEWRSFKGCECQSTENGILAPEHLHCRVSVSGWDCEGCDRAFGFLSSSSRFVLTSNVLEKKNTLGIVWSLSSLCLLLVLLYWQCVSLKATFHYRKTTMTCIHFKGWFRFLWFLFWYVKACWGIGS